jgi:hypothetical protein
MKHLFRVAVLLLSVAALYVSAAAPVAMADGNPLPLCGGRACR